MTETQHKMKKVNASMNTNIIFELSLFNVFLLLDAKQQHRFHAQNTNHSVYVFRFWFCAAIDFFWLNFCNIILISIHIEWLFIESVLSIIWSENIFFFGKATDLFYVSFNSHTMTELYQFDYCVNNTKNATTFRYLIKWRRPGWAVQNGNSLDIECCFVLSFRLFSSFHLIWVPICDILFFYLRCQASISTKKSGVINVACDVV